MSTAALPASADVVVVGGGVMGASTAFHLAVAGADVLVLERDELASGSSGKPVGGVRAQFSDPVNVALGARSLAAFADFARRPGADIGLRRGRTRPDRRRPFLALAVGAFELSGRRSTGPGTPSWSRCRRSLPTSAVWAPPTSTT